MTDGTNAAFGMGIASIQDSEENFYYASHKLV